MAEIGNDMFVAEANMINENAWNFISDTNAIRNENMELIEEKKTNDMLGVLKDAAQEMGIKTFNELAGKYGGKMYNYKTSLFGNNSLKDLDAKLGENIIDKVGAAEQFVGKGLSNFQNKLLLPRSYDLGTQKISLKDLGIGYDNLRQNSHSVMNGLGDDPLDFESRGSRALSDWNESNPDSDITDESFDTFLRNRTQNIPRDENGELVFQPIQTNTENVAETSNRPMVDDELGNHNEEIGNPDNMTMYENEAEELSADYIRATSEVSMGQENAFDSVGEIAGHTAVEDAETAAGSSAEKIVKTGGEVAGKAAGEETAGAITEGIGTALDATGFLAPFGALFNLAGTALDVAGLVQTGVGVEHFVQDDVLQKAPSRRDPTIPLPNAPLTMAQRGFGITPNYDSLNMPGMTSSSW